MKRIPRLTLASILAVAVLVVPSMLAAAKELASLTVSGPGINGVLALNNSQGLLQLEQYGFFGTTTDTSTLANVPQNLGQGYQVVGYLNLDGKSVPFVQGIYYPGISGAQGYIHFTGALDTATMKPTKADRWAVVNSQAAASFSRMVAAQGVILQAAQRATASHTAASLPAATALPSSLLLAALVGVGAMLAGGRWMKRRQGALQA